MTKPSELSMYVLAFIQSNHGVTVDEIATQLDKPKNKVKSAVDRLMRSEKIDSHAISKGIAARYTAAFKAPAMVQPMNGPGHTMKPMGKLDAPTSAPHRTGTMTDDYLGPELRPYEGRPGAMDAYNLPSMHNGCEVPRKRPSLMCVGVVSGPVGTGQPRRFA